MIWEIGGIKRVDGEVWYKGTNSDGLRASTSCYIHTYRFWVLNSNPLIRQYERNDRHFVILDSYEYEMRKMIDLFS